MSRHRLGRSGRSWCQRCGGVPALARRRHSALGWRPGSGGPRREALGIFMISSATANSPAPSATASSRALTRGRAARQLRSVLRLCVICCSCSGSREAVVGAFGATFYGADLRNGYALLFGTGEWLSSSQPEPSSHHLPGLRRPTSSGAFVAIYLLALHRRKIASQSGCNTN